MNVESLLTLMVHKKASDLFVIAGRPPCMKVNGKVEPISPKSLSEPMARELVLGAMDARQRDEFENA
ncbi:MAG: type IV pili twitching motility protein PilT, partial [Methylothermaceae bacterium]|nr:type IV pili twitching motility protein PilT [Methylothermaceae bacterium]